MKTLLFSFFVLFSLSLSIFAQSISVTGRSVGAGTYITVPIIGNTGYPQGLTGFEMKVFGDKFSPIRPLNFFPGNHLGRNNWMSTYFLTDSSLNVAAVGNQVWFENSEIGSLQLLINQNVSGNNDIGYIRFFDGNTYWPSGYSPFNVIQLPQTKYGDLDDNGVINISDAILEFQMVGVSTINDTLAVIADLNGDGNPVLTWEVYLLLQKIVNPDYIFPIFNGGCSGGGCGKTITATWQKMSTGKWGLFSNEKITNGDLIVTGSLQSNGSGWFKKINNNVYFLNNSAITDPILTAEAPFTLSGTLNEGRPIRISSTTDVAGEKTLPTTFKLEQNYPNPFNPSTTINYAIQNTGFVTLKVYDMLGTEIATLVNEQKPAGSYSIKFDASNMPSGVYVYRIQSGSFVKTQKMILMK